MDLLLLITILYDTHFHVRTLTSMWGEESPWGQWWCCTPCIFFLCKTVLKYGGYSLLLLNTFPSIYTHVLKSLFNQISNIDVNLAPDSTINSSVSFQSRILSSFQSAKYILDLSFCTFIHIFYVSGTGINNIRLTCKGIKYTHFGDVDFYFLLTSKRWWFDTPLTLKLVKAMMAMPHCW